MRNWPNVFDRLFDNAMVQDNGCWEFTHNQNRKGYGRLRYKGQSCSAHRVAYILCVDDIPDGIFVLHKCDNTACVNPKHLYLGTHQDNMTDRNLKNRQARLKGMDCGGSKLTDSEVLQIRQYLLEGLTQRTIARKFDVSQNTIMCINTRKTWSHI